MKTMKKIYLIGTLPFTMLMGCNSNSNTSADVVTGMPPEQTKVERVVGNNDEYEYTNNFITPINRDIVKSFYDDYIRTNNVIMAYYYHGLKDTSYREFCSFLEYANSYTNESVEDIFNNNSPNDIQDGFLMFVFQRRGYIAVNNKNTLSMDKCTPIDNLNKMINNK